VTDIKRTQTQFYPLGRGHKFNTNRNKTKVTIEKFSRVRSIGKVTWSYLVMEEVSELEWEGYGKFDRKKMLSKTWLEFKLCESRAFWQLESLINLKGTEHVSCRRFSVTICEVWENCICDCQAAGIQWGCRADSKGDRTARGGVRVAELPWA
jgi:hypothetical protein